MQELTGRSPGGNPFAGGYDLSISNLGRAAIPAEYGPLRIERLFAPTMNVLQPVHRILGVTTFGGALCGTYTSRDPQAPDLAARGREVLTSMLAPAAATRAQP